MLRPTTKYDMILWAVCYQWKGRRKRIQKDYDKIPGMRLIETGDD